jgi:hypothetical protein
MSAGITSIIGVINASKSLKTDNHWILVMFLFERRSSPKRKTMKCMKRVGSNVINARNGFIRSVRSSTLGKTRISDQSTFVPAVPLTIVGKRGFQKALRLLQWRKISNGRSCRRGSKSMYVKRLISTLRMQLRRNQRGR